MKKPQEIFFAQNKQRKIFICTWPEHSTIASSWMLKCYASAVVVVVAEKNVNITEHVVITLLQFCNRYR